MTQLKIINGTYKEPTAQDSTALALMASGGGSMEDNILKTLDMQRKS